MAACWLGVAAMLMCLVGLLLQQQQGLVVNTCQIDNEIDKLWVVTTCLGESEMDVGYLSGDKWTDDGPHHAAHPFLSG